MDPTQTQVAEWCGAKLFRIRELIEREPTTSLANRILGVLNELPPWTRPSAELSRVNRENRLMVWGRTEMENRYYVVARETPDGICEVSVSTRSLAEAQQKRHRIVENTQDTGYFVAYADIPEPHWQRL